MISLENYVEDQIALAKWTYPLNFAYFIVYSFSSYALLYRSPMKSKSRNYSGDFLRLQRCFEVFGADSQLWQCLDWRNCPPLCSALEIFKNYSELIKYAANKRVKTSLQIKKEDHWGNHNHDLQASILRTDLNSRMFVTMTTKFFACYCLNLRPMEVAAPVTLIWIVQYIGTRGYKWFVAQNERHNLNNRNFRVQLNPYWWNV